MAAVCGRGRLTSVLDAIDRSGVTRRVLRALRSSLGVPASASSTATPAALGPFTLRTLASIGSPLGGFSGGLSRRDRGRPILHRAFERTRAPLIEIEAAGDRIHRHLHVLDLDAEARDLEHEVVDQLVVQRLHPRQAVGRARIHLRLDVQRFGDRAGIEEQLENGVQEPANAAEQPAMGVVDRAVFEREVGRGSFLVPRAPELVQQVRTHARRVEKRVQFRIRQLPDFLFRVIGAALLADARADLPHDLLHVYRIGADAEVCHQKVPERSYGCWWSALRLRAANSGASLMQVPRMPIERFSARAPVNVISAWPSPTCGYPCSSGVSCSQLRNNRPHGLSSAPRIMRRPLKGYQKLSWYTTLARYAQGASTVLSDHSTGLRRGPQ